MRNNPAENVRSMHAVMRRLHGLNGMVALLAIVLLAAPALAQRTTAILPERFPMQVGEETLRLPYISQPALGQGTDRITHVLVNVHGTFRNAELYHRVSRMVAARSGRGATTLLITPQFPMAADLRASGLDDDIAFWTNAGWKRGDQSRSTSDLRRSESISSYAALERMLVSIAEQYGSLERIVIVGHSAGGQYANRFAASNRVHDWLGERGIEVHYIVSNPSSYVYFCDHRLLDPENGTFGPVPQSIRERCPSFNHYTRGSERLNRYMSRVGLARLREQYAARSVTYIMGAEDNDPEGAYLDRSCGALLQGPHRLARAQTYHDYLAYRLGEEVHERHRLYVLEGVGHSARRIFTSDIAVRTIFDQMPTQHGGARQTSPVE
ncbi:MAG: alpha/beta fold hydrolase [Phycisphaerales bacterium]|nr:MAG: alpha/beta fold hydrolase [Phycisphaerales bacterium]